MTEDEVLIERIRPILRRRKGFSEKRMFGGVCFMINGNMCAGTWKGALIVRLARENHEATLAEPHTKPADMAGRIMKGWAVVGPVGISTEDDLKNWVRRAAKLAGSLPPK